MTLAVVECYGDLESTKKRHVTPSFNRTVWPAVVAMLGPDNPIYVVNNDFLGGGGGTRFRDLLREFDGLGGVDAGEGVFRIPSLGSFSHQQRETLRTVMSYDGHLNVLLGLRSDEDKVEKVGRLWAKRRHFVFGEAESCGVADWLEFGKRVRRCLVDGPLVGFEHDGSRLYVFTGGEGVEEARERMID